MIYDRSDLDELQKCVDVVAKQLRPMLHEIDCLVVQGVSGLLVGAPVALKLKVPIVIVRKANDKSHDQRTVLNAGALGRYNVFLDDFRSSGRTERAVQTALALTDHALSACYFYRDWHCEGSGWDNSAGWQLPIWATALTRRTGTDVAAYAGVIGVDIH